MRTLTAWCLTGLVAASVLVWAAPGRGQNGPTRGAPDGQGVGPGPVGAAAPAEAEFSPPGPWEFQRVGVRVDYEDFHLAPLPGYVPPPEPPGPGVIPRFGSGRGGRSRGLPDSPYPRISVMDEMLRIRLPGLGDARPVNVRPVPTPHGETPEFVVALDLDPHLARESETHDRGAADVARAKAQLRAALNQAVTRLGAEMQAAYDRTIAAARKELDELKAKQPGLEKEVKDADQAVAALKEREGRLRAALIEEDLADPVQPGDTAGLLSQLQAEKRRLDLDVLAKKARREAIERGLAEYRAKVEAQIKVDPIAAEIEKVIAIREEYLKRIDRMVATGTAPTADLNAAQAALAESRIQLLQRRESVATIGGDALAKFNGELLSLGVDAAELEVRAKVVASRLALVRDARALSDPLEQARQRHSQAQGELGTVAKRVQDLEEALKTPAPKVELREAPPASQPAP